jgi:hypothetical protein
MKTSKLVVGLCSAFVALGACAADNSCNGQPATQSVEPPPSFEAPNYSADEDAAEEQAMQARFSAWQIYATSVHDRLAKTNTPRDWALATLADVASLAPDMEEHPSIDSGVLIQRAVAAAPDDLIVQWIGAVSNVTPSSTSSAALKNLERIEPQNGAHWLHSVNEAKKKGDENSIDTLLAHIGASHDFDNHFADITAAMVDVYRRFPPPSTLVSGADPELSGEPTIPWSMAVASAVTIGSGANGVVEGCRVGTIPEKSETRRTDCANIGHLMLARGTDLSSQRLGATVLRISKTFNDDDVRAARTLDWMQTQFFQIEEKDPRIIFSELRLLPQTKNETEAMRQTMVAAGMAISPPDDWVDKESSFSPARLKADEARLQKSVDAN